MPAPRGNLAMPDAAVAGSGLLPIPDSYWLQSFFNERWFGRDQRWPVAADGTFRIPVLPMPMSYRVGGLDVALADGPVEGVDARYPWQQVPR
jgi:hypothetical protein